MLQDRLAGKPLEIDCLTGAVTEIAARVGVDVPQTRAVHDLVMALGDLGDPLRAQDPAGRRSRTGSSGGAASGAPR
jgi:Ketopantoate reductase PanE/ApbA C terminal